MITKKMKGDIELISRIGHGTKVKFYFETQYNEFKEFEDTDICLSDRKVDIVDANNFKFF